MDELDEAILTVLIDGKPRSFHQLLEAVDLSHNTLRLHLDQLVEEVLVTKEKITGKMRGRPSYIYSLNSGRRGMASSPNTGYGDLVSLLFRCLGQLCRLEKGSFCEKAKVPCTAQNCPQMEK
ncbi:hypothetical protein MUP77_19360 [Candidatus Bathyarchaeota archaeon]|nr:hypothetical protein [Candidatus Bathyarchaeota archaeon]